MAYDYNDILIAISRQMGVRETAELEFKSAKGGLPKSLWETYSAFANTHGGTIVLGVKEKDGLISLNNLTEIEIDKLLKDFWNGVHNKGLVNVCLLREADVEVIEIHGKKVILFHVPQAQRDQRPVHCTQNAFNGTFRRNYEGDYLCTQAEVRRMFADADVNRPADGRILRNYTWDDIDIPSLEQYRRLFALAKPGHPWLSLSNDALMRKLGGYRKDRETQEEGFTLAGLLMFGKYDAIKDDSCAPRFFPDYKEIPGDIIDTRWLDRIYPDGTWESNLFQFYRRVLPKLQEIIPTPFKLEGNQRRDETPAHEALREAFANLCVHADYSEDSSLLVFRHPHRIVFSNPGVMLISRQQYYQGGESVCRNTNLQRMFMMLGTAEKAGSGVDRIMKGWESLNWKRPYPIEKSQPNKVELIMPLESLLDNSILAALSHRFGEKMKKLKHQDIMALSIALTEGVVNNERLRDVLSLHPADMTHLLRKLCKDGFLASSGYGRGTIYNLAEANEDGETLQADGETLQASGETLQASSETLYTPKREMPLRMSRQELQKIILDYCCEWRSAEDIAKYVRRTKQYIRGEVLSEMSDLLIKKFPQIEKHPGQKYKIKN